jgi:hypothetical protein
MTKLIAFRLPENIEIIVNKDMKLRNISERTEYIKQALLNYAGYKIEPAKIIKK